MGFDYDIVVVGAGLLGCFTARNLCRHNWRVAVFEKNRDVCSEVSKANTAIIYPGYDAKPGSLKARLCLEANKSFDNLCSQLGVRLRRTGSLMVSFGARGDRVIREKCVQGLENGVRGLRLLSSRETIDIEPDINPAVTGSLFAETSATVNPWELGIAAARNAVKNSADFFLSAKVTSIRKTDEGYVIAAGEKEYTARAVVNCAGLYGDEISELVNAPRFRLETSTADYLLLDEMAGGHVRHIIMHEPEQKGRGATIVPTVDGNLLLGPSRIKSSGKTDFGTTREGCEFVKEVCGFVFPQIPIDMTIRSFATIRPSISIVGSDSHGSIIDTGERIRDLLIYEAENPGFINLAGIRTPGLTCCDEIGRHVSDMLLERLGNPGLRTDFDPTVEAPVRFAGLDIQAQAAMIGGDPGYGRLVCHCQGITEAEIRFSIRQSLGAVSVDAVKRRTGAMMGRCQGGFCMQRIIEILSEELGVPINEICKDEKGSEMIWQ